MKLQKKLNGLFGMMVRNFHFNMFDHELSLDVIDVKGEREEIEIPYQIRFNRVSSFFADDPYSLEFNNYHWEKGLLNSLYYIPNEKLETAINSEISQDFNTPIKYNIFFEIWECVIFLKAEQVIINGKVYDLQSP